MSQDKIESNKKRIVLIGDDGTGKTSVLLAFFETKSKEPATDKAEKLSIPEKSEPLVKEEKEPNNTEDAEKTLDSEEKFEEETQEKISTESKEDLNQENLEVPKDEEPLNKSEEKKEENNKVVTEESTEPKKEVNQQELDALLSEIDSKLFSTTVKSQDKDYELAVWDTASENDFKDQWDKIFNKADGIILFFSIDSRDSFSNITKKWAPILKKNAKNVPVILVGNKVDLRKENESNEKLVSTEDGNKLKKKIGAKLFLECSAESSHNVKALFEAAATLNTKKQKKEKKSNKAAEKKECLIS